MLKSGVFKHVTCRNNIYPKSSVDRFNVPDEFVYWTVAFLGYLPPTYTAPHIKNQIWADQNLAADKCIDISFQPKWNSLDGSINRVSYNGVYDIEDKFPRNPIGRTGLQGRGLLGRWGPNHAADPIVTRWKRNADETVIKHSKTNK